MLSLSLLGAPRLERSGARGRRPLTPDTRKALALAAYLALTGAPHRREALAALFYPDSDTAHARAALRRTLSALKTALGADVLTIEEDTVALAPSNGLTVDALEFRALVARGDLASLERAADLYRGDFLEGFTLRDSPAFDEWQFFETESLRRELAAALEQLTTSVLTTPGRAPNALARGIAYARRWLALDPLHEPAHRALMELYARDGQRAAALRQYHECVRRLEQELGVAPLLETTALYRAIEENRLPPRAPAPRVPSSTASARSPVAVEDSSGQRSSLRPLPSVLVPYPLVGRAHELAVLQRAYERIHTEGHLLVVEGEPGIGKTRLASEFLEPLTARGAPLLAGRAYQEQQSLAYAPFVTALRAALADPPAAARLNGLSPTVLADAARLLPELAASPTLPASDGPGAQVRFFEAITRLLAALLSVAPASDSTNANPIAPPGILFLDDAQWADEASLDLLAFFVRRLARLPVAVLLTWRSEELGRDHPLRLLYAGALRDERATLVSLSRLGEEPMRELVVAAAARGAPIPPELASQLYRESEGQPFFLVEYLQLVQTQGAPPDKARGDTSPAPALTIPATVRELLHSRLAHVGEPALQLLSAAAVVGRSFDFQLLHAVSGRGEMETLSALEELTAHGLVSETTRDTYDFTHDKLRTLVYDETGLARRRLLHRRAAEVLSTLLPHGPAGGAWAGQIARHYRAAGADALAAEFFKRAGDDSRNVLANRDAIEHYSAALALGHPDPAALHLAIGDARTLLGEYDAALSAYETAAAFGAPGAESRIARVCLRRGEWERAARHLESALALTPDVAEQAHLLADLALASHHGGHEPSARKSARRALQAARRAPAGRPRDLALARVHNTLGILARAAGDGGAARKHLEASRDLAAPLNDASACAAALNNLALVAYSTGEHAAALEYAQRALALVTQEGDRHRAAALHNHLADIYHALARPADSMRELKQAVAIYAEIGGPPGDWLPAIWKLEEW